MSGPQWDCSAYGPDGTAAGAWCFIAGAPGARVCTGLAACRTVMDAERRRVFARISELAAHGDETGAYLAGEFPGPGSLLGGEDQGGAS